MEAKIYENFDPKSCQLGLVIYLKPLRLILLLNSDIIPISYFWLLLITVLCKISAVKRLGNDLNFQIDLNEKVSNMSEIIHICDIFRGRSAKL